MLLGAERSATPRTGDGDPITVLDQLPPLPDGWGDAGEILASYRAVGAGCGQGRRGDTDRDRTARPAGIAGRAAAGAGHGADSRGGQRRSRPVHRRKSRCGDCRIDRRAPGGKRRGAAAAALTATIRPAGSATAGSTPPRPANGSVLASGGRRRHRSAAGGRHRCCVCPEPRRRSGHDHRAAGFLGQHPTSHRQRPCDFLRQRPRDCPRDYGRRSAGRRRVRLATRGRSAHHHRRRTGLHGRCRCLPLGCCAGVTPATRRRCGPRSFDGALRRLRARPAGPSPSVPDAARRPRSPPRPGSPGQLRDRSSSCCWIGPRRPRPRRHCRGGRAAGRT